MELELDFSSFRPGQANLQFQLSILLKKNPQFSSNLADIQAKLPTHEVVILTKFHKDCKNIFDFLLTEKCLVVPFFMHHPTL